MRWQVIVFGWPGATACIALTTLGLFLRRPMVLAAAAMFGLGFTVYMFAAAPLVGALSVVGQIGAVMALRAKRPALAYVLAIPTIALMAIPVGLALR